MNLIAVKDKVEKQLGKHKHVRDDNRKLVANIWWQNLKLIAEKKGKTIQEMTAMDLLTELANNNLDDYESITRVSRTLQEKHEIYRGEKYIQRQAEQEKIKHQLHNI